MEAALTDIRDGCGRNPSYIGNGGVFGGGACEAVTQMHETALTHKEM